MDKKITPEEAVRYKARARETALSEPDVALEALTAVIESDPNDIEAYLLRAGVNAVKTNYIASHQDINTALRLQPDSPDVFTERALINCEMQRYVDALDDCNSSLELEPNVAKTYVVRGMTYYNLGEDDNALDDFSVACAQEGLDAEDEHCVFTHRGKIYMKQQKWVEALINLTLALEHETNDLETRKIRSFAAFEIDAYRIALHDINTVLVAEPIGDNYLSRSVAKDGTRYGGGDAEKDRQTAGVLNNLPIQVVINEAIENLMHMKHDEVIGSLDEALSLAPGISELYYMRGIAKHESDRKKDAIEDFDAAIESDRFNINAIIARGEAHAECNNEDAKADFDRAARLLLYQAKIFMLEAIVALHSRGTEGAARAFANLGIAAEMVNDTPYSMYILRAIAKGRLGLYASSLQDVRRANDMNETPFGDGLLSVAHASMGNYQAALEAATSALASKDVKPQLRRTLHLLRSRLYTDLRSTKHAVADRMEAMKLDVNSDLPLIDDYDQFYEILPEDNVIGNSAYVARLNNEIDIQDLTISIDNSDAADVDAYYERGCKYIEIGDAAEKAIADLTRVIEIQPECPKAYYERAKAYRSDGQFDRAIADFTTAISMTSESAEMHHEIGVTYAVSGDLDVAMESFTFAIKIDPDFAEAYLGRAVTYNRQNETEKAIADCTDYIDLCEDAEKCSFAYMLRSDLYRQQYEATKETDPGASSLLMQAVCDFMKAKETRPDNG